MDAFDGEVRLAVYRWFVEEERAPRAEEIADVLDEPSLVVAEAFERLAAERVLVLEPGMRRIWMAMPFSGVPTDFRVESGARGWSANCALDALGIPALLHADAEIYTRCPDCSAELVLVVRDGAVVEPASVVHFAVPPARWWDDIGFT